MYGGKMKWNMQKHRLKKIMWYLCQQKKWMQKIRCLFYILPVLPVNQKV